jgi:hypothetical protein
MTENNIIRDLGNGLIMRAATVADTDELVKFNGRIHSEGSDEPDEFVMNWVRDLMTRPHPTLKPSDFLVVIDAKTNKIVSTLNYIPQTWSYAGIPFEVGRPELVGTDEAYRRRGLVRAMFEVIHQWGVERGHKMQGITGIPWYYRLFEYEMCVNLGGSRIGYIPHVPKLKDDETENFTFRLAVEADIPFISEVYDYGVQRSLLACVRDEPFWQYDIFGKSEGNSAAWIVIETLEKEPVGFIIHPKKMQSSIMQAWEFELKVGASYLEITPAVIRYLDKTGREQTEKNEKVEYAGYGFGLGGEHPAYEALPGRMPRIDKPYAWYMRIPDLVDFLTHIGPVLEQRLAASPATGHTGDLKVSFFRSGIKFSFDKGALKQIENYTPKDIDDGDFLCPDLTFLRILLGHNSSEELEEMLADCFPRNDHGRALMRFLFPKQTSCIWMLN